MDAKSPEGLKLTETLKESVVGKEVKLNLPSLCKAMSTENCQAMLTSKEDGLWVFSLYWYAMQIAEVSIELRKDKYLFEEL